MQRTEKVRNKFANKKEPKGESQLPRQRSKTPKQRAKENERERKRQQIIGKSNGKRTWRTRNKFCRRKKCNFCAVGWITFLKRYDQAQLANTN